MNKQMNIILTVLMIVAVATVACALLNYRALTDELRSVESQLAESQQKWVKTDAEKTWLQKMVLNPWRENLRRQRYALDDATQRVSEIKAQNDALKNEISELKSRLNP